MGDPAQFERLLSASPFFGRLEPDTRRAVAGLCVTHSLARGETLFLKDDPADAFYAIRRGEIRITAGTGAGRRMTLNVLGPGDIFGEIALFDGRPRSADAVAAEPAELFAVRRRDMLEKATRLLASLKCYLIAQEHSQSNKTPLLQEGVEKDRLQAAAKSWQQ